MKYSRRRSRKRCDVLLVEAGVVAVHGFFEVADPLVEPHHEYWVLGGGMLDVPGTSFIIASPEDLLPDLMPVGAILVMAFTLVSAEETLHCFTS